MPRKKVVIIDDEEDLCQLMKSFLNDLDYDVFLAHTLTKGLAVIQEVTPDIVFIDNNLPDGLGWDQMNFLVREYPNCKINLISAYSYVSPTFDETTSLVSIIEKPLSLNTIRNYL